MENQVCLERSAYVCECVDFFIGLIFIKCSSNFGSCVETEKDEDTRIAFSDTVAKDRGA